MAEFRKQGVVNERNAPDSKRFLPTVNICNRLFARCKKLRIPKLRRRSRRCQNESLRLTRLLDEILDINRLEARTPDMPLERLDAAQAIVTACGAASGMASGGAVKVLPPAGPLKVRANTQRMRQLLINLLSNALKYNGSASPRIGIYAARVGQTINTDGRNNGGGVSGDGANTIFKKFVRGKRVDSGLGTGLGLPVNRAFMRAIGDNQTIILEPDGTSFFRLSLPRMVDAA